MTYSQGFSPDGAQTKLQPGEGAACERATNLVLDIRPTPNPYSLEAFFNLQDDKIRADYRKVVTSLLRGPKTADGLEVDTNIRGNSLRPRLDELRKMGIVIDCGTGITRTGHKAAKLTLHLP
jgi:hypothetical protein